MKKLIVFLLTVFFPVVAFTQIQLGIKPRTNVRQPITIRNGITPFPTQKQPNYNERLLQQNERALQQQQQMIHIMNQMEQNQRNAEMWRRLYGD